MLSSYVVPFVRVSFGARSFIIANPVINQSINQSILNSLPPALRMCTFLDTFHRHFQSRYFQKTSQSLQHLPSCASDSASADHYACL